MVVSALRGFRLNFNEADRHKSRAPHNQRRTDGLTDRSTDKAAYRVAYTRLKIRSFGLDAGMEALRNEQGILLVS